MSKAKDALRAITPRAVRHLRARRRLRRFSMRSAGASNRDIFSAVYANSDWGTTDGGGLSSGDGSRRPQLADPYVAVVSGFLRSLPQPVTVVDLGCGDFSVGARIRLCAAEYIACDVVPSLIEADRASLDNLDVDFRCIDIAQDPLPDGNVAIVRQVLQHLCNADIVRVARKLEAYPHVVVTEHISPRRVRTESRHAVGSARAAGRRLRGRSGERSLQSPLPALTRALHGPGRTRRHRDHALRNNLAGRYGRRIPLRNGESPNEIRR